MNKQINLASSIVEDEKKTMPYKTERSLCYPVYGYGYLGPVGPGMG